MIELAYFAAGWAAALSSVALGGYLVFRTKKETHEPLFGQAKAPDEVAVNILDDVDVPRDSVVKAPVEIQSRNDEFVHAFADRVAKAARARHTP